MFDLRKTWITLGIAAALILPTAKTVVAGQTRPNPTVEYVVRPGDTLWQIAQRAGLQGDRRRAVDLILELNEGVGAALRPGQTLLLPQI